MTDWNVKGSRIHKKDEKGTIDSKLIDEWLDYTTDKHQKVVAKHKLASHDLYLTFDSWFGENKDKLKVPEKGEIEDDSVITDILAQYVTLAIERVRPNANFGEYMKTQKFKNWKEKRNFIMNKASKYLGIKGEDLQKMVGAVEDNEDIVGELHNYIGKPLEDGKIAEKMRTDTYNDIFGDVHHDNYGVFAKTLGQNEKFQALYSVDDADRLKHLTPSDEVAQVIMAGMAQGKNLFNAKEQKKHLGKYGIGLNKK